MSKHFRNRQVFSQHRSHSDEKRVKNQVFCPSAQQNKLRFETEIKADRYLSFLDAADFVTGSMPIRSYHCSSCCAWHVTSREVRGDRKK